MKLFYSASTGGFYDDEIHGENIPSDAVEISQEDHSALLEGQTSGKVIVANNDGFPELADPKPPTDDELINRCKAEAKRRLAESDFSELPSVRAAITNGAEFDAYRAAVRALAINPVKNPTFPERVSAVWA